MLKVEKLKQSETYKCTISGPYASETGLLIAPITLVTDSQWASVVQSKAAGSIADAFLQYSTGDFTMILPQATYQTWQGPNPVQIQVELGFLATSKGGYEEVVKPSSNLAKIPLTPEIRTPLPPPVNLKTEAYTVSVGNWFHATLLLPDNVQVNYGHVYDSNGHPVSATVSCSFVTKRAISQGEFLGWFNF